MDPSFLGPSISSQLLVRKLNSTKWILHLRNLLGQHIISGTKFLTSELTNNQVLNMTNGEQIIVGLEEFNVIPSAFILAADPLDTITRCNLSPEQI